MNTFPITLKEEYMISPNVKHFVFTSAQSPAFDYIPGQFITIHFSKNEKILRRSYSIANAPTADNCIEFAASYVEGGPGTELLFNLKPGDNIQISGPFGRLILKEELPTRYIFAATSTGTTPYRAMIPALCQQLIMNPALQVIILQGVSTREAILYGKDFHAFVEQFPNQVRFMPCLSRENKETLLEHEYGGYIQSAFPALGLNPDEDLVYLCGNPSMIDHAFQQLQDRGFTTPRIIREKYLSR
jgi:ferredoxin-NADP reductase